MFCEFVLCVRLDVSPKLCETRFRWSEKYKSIHDFKDHLVDTISALETLDEEGYAATRKMLIKSNAAVCKSSFIVSVPLIAKYSAILEPVVNALQLKTLGIVKANQNIQTIFDMLWVHREYVENVTTTIFFVTTTGDITMNLNVDITVTCIVGQQKHSSNHPAKNPSEFWRSLIIPYLDSIISSLGVRFSAGKSLTFSLISFNLSNKMCFIGGIIWKYFILCNILQFRTDWRREGIVVQNVEMRYS